MDLKIVNLSFYLICLYGIVLMICNYTLRKQIVYQNIKINKKKNYDSNSGGMYCVRLWFYEDGYMVDSTIYIISFSY